MADDERRAEIEAVALVIYESRLHTSFINGWSAEPEALRDRFRKAAVSALDRVRDARGDDEAAVWRSMLDRIRIHGASGLWTGEDCAIGAVAALEGGDAGRAFMLEREAARPPQDEDHEARLTAELQALVDWFNEAPFLRAERLLYDLYRASRVPDYGEIVSHHPEGPDQIVAPQGEDHEAGIEAMGEVWVKLGNRDGLFGCVGLLDEASRRALIERYLSRVSPSRDGSVAVEDVERARDIAVQAMMDALSWMPPDVGKRFLQDPSYKRFLAEFSPASTGDREDEQ